MQFLLTVPAAILCVIPIAVSAHHSRAHFSGEFREVEGEIVSRRWGNPHAGIVMRAVNEQGEEETWRVDLLGTGGLTRDAFAAGQRLTVAGPLSSGGVREILATNLLFPDGIEVLLGAVEPYWSANLEPGRVPARVDTLVDGTAENRGLFRVWSSSAEDWERYIGALHGYFFLGELSEAERAQAWSEVKFGAWQAEPYTEAAIAGRADWDPLDNFATRCEPEGMPRIMMNPNPFEFVDQGSEITL